MAEGTTPMNVWRYEVNQIDSTPGLDPAAELADGLTRLHEQAPTRTLVSVLPSAKGGWLAVFHWQADPT
jgi:hypothetical protein